MGGLLGGKAGKAMDASLNKIDKTGILKSEAHAVAGAASNSAVGGNHFDAMQVLSDNFGQSVGNGMVEGAKQLGQESSDVQKANEIYEEMAKEEVSDIERFFSSRELYNALNPSQESINNAYQDQVYSQQAAREFGDLNKSLLSPELNKALNPSYVEVANAYMAQMVSEQIGGASTTKENANSHSSRPVGLLNSSTAQLLFGGDTPLLGDTLDKLGHLAKEQIYTVNKGLKDGGLYLGAHTNKVGKFSGNITISGSGEANRVFGLPSRWIGAKNTKFLEAFGYEGSLNPLMAYNPKTWGGRLGILSVGASYINNYMKYDQGITSTQQYIVDNLDTTTGALTVPIATSGALTYGGGVLSGLAVRGAASEVAGGVATRVGAALGLAALPLELPAIATVGLSIGVGVGLSVFYNNVISPKLVKPTYNYLATKTTTAYHWVSTKYTHWRGKR